MRSVFQGFGGVFCAIQLAAAASPILPITFEEQSSSVPKSFLARPAHYRVWLRSHGASIVSQDGQLLQMRLEGSTNSGPAGMHKLVTRTNYLVGSDPSQWRTGIANYEQVSYSRIYPGIDLIWHETGGEIEHDFAIAAGADPGRIRIRISGAALRLTAGGDLNAGAFRFHRPRAYQDGRQVECRYKPSGTVIRFALGHYNHSRPLTIDPVLSFSTLLGGSQNDSNVGIALDSAGNIYVAGTTASIDFPVTPGAFQTVVPGGQCFAIGPIPGPQPCTSIFVTKLSSDGSTILYSTYLGGPDSATAITVDRSGAVYLMGVLGSGFPKLMTLTGNPATEGGLAIAKLSPDGSSLIYATLLPSGANAFAVDAAGAVYITGVVLTSIPVVNAFQAAPAGRTFFKTSDAGNHWQILNTDLPMQLATLLVQDPANPQVLYAGFSGGLVKSTDGGSHWSSINNGLDPGASPIALAIDPRFPQTLYVCTERSRLFKSTDGGASWTLSGAGISGILRILAIDPTSSTVYAGTDSALFKSTDGALWSPTGLARLTALAFDPSQPGVLYAGAGTGLWKSTDSGATWTVFMNGLPGGNFASIAIDPENPQMLYVSDSSTLYRTTDGGLHWTRSQLPFPFGPVGQIVVDPALHSRIWAGTGAGVLVSTDSGATWAPTPSSFPHLILVGLTVDAAGDIYALALGPGSETFVLKLDSTGSRIVYSTYLGGSGNDVGTGIAVDAAGRAYVTGQTDSLDFPLAAAVQPTIGGDYDAFVTVLDPSGAHLVWSTYFGDSHAQQAPRVALDPAGNVHVAGSQDNGSSLFAAKFRGDGSSILSTAYIGASATLSNANYANAVAADAMGNTYVLATTSDPGLPTVDAAQPSLAGKTDAFVAAWNGAGDLQSATYLGGSGNDTASGIAVTNAGDVYLAGTTSSSDFPQKYSLQAYGSCTPSSNGCAPTHVFVAKLSVSGSGPVLRLNGVTNAASYSPALAPGELVSLWGADMGVSVAVAGQLPLPARLSGVQVTVNGVPAPLVYASASQVNVQVPFETQPGAAQITVTSDAGMATQNVQIAAAAPAIFTLNARGTGAGAIQHAGNYQVVTDASPAAAGEIITIYCTGLGAVTPAAQTGAAAPPPPSQTVVPVQVSIGGAAAEVLYAGVAPGFAGLYQINARISPGTPSGAQPVQITANQAASNIVTVAIQ